MSGRLVVRAHGRVVGAVTKDLVGRLSFDYDDAWIDLAGAFPLSLSMPLAVKTHRHRAIATWMAGLLPDSLEVRSRWARAAGGSPNSPYDLLAARGRDCAGAVQLVSEDGAGQVEDAGGLGGPQLESAGAGVAAQSVSQAASQAVSRTAWLKPGDLDAWLTRTRSDPGAWETREEGGGFALTGSRPKTALVRSGERWGVPDSSSPTTHILKPADPTLPGHCANEHLCQELARALDIPAARTWLIRIGRHTALAVQRYDRVLSGGALAERSGPVRIHKESVAQSLGVAASGDWAEGVAKDGRRGRGRGMGGRRAAGRRKRASKAGLDDIARLMRTHSDRPGDDLRTLTRILVLGWLLGGTTGAGDLSVLIGAGGRAALAPIHGMKSRLLYEGQYAHRIELPLAIGGERRIGYIRARHWRRYARGAELPAREVIDLCKAIVEEAPERFTEVLQAKSAAGIGPEIAQRLREEVAGRARMCLTTLGGRRRGAVGRAGVRTAGSARAAGAAPKAQRVVAGGVKASPGAGLAGRMASRGAGSAGRAKSPAAGDARSAKSPDPGSRKAATAPSKGSGPGSGTKPPEGPKPPGRPSPPTTRRTTRKKTRSSLIRNLPPPSLWGPKK